MEDNETLYAIWLNNSTLQLLNIVSSLLNNENNEIIDYNEILTVLLCNAIKELKPELIENNKDNKDENEAKILQFPTMENKGE